MLLLWVMSMIWAWVQYSTVQYCCPKMNKFVQYLVYTWCICMHISNVTISLAHSLCLFFALATKLHRTRLNCIWHLVNEMKKLQRATCPHTQQQRRLVGPALPDQRQTARQVFNARLKWFMCEGIWHLTVAVAVKLSNRERDTSWLYYLQ